MSDKLESFKTRRGDINHWYVVKDSAVVSYARWSLLHRETDAATDVINYLHEYRTYEEYCTVVANFCALQICFWHEEHDEKIKQTIEKVLAKESLLRIWGTAGSGIMQLRRLVDTGRNWHTEYTSEHLRLFGAVIEEIAEIAGGDKAKIINFNLNTAEGICKVKSFKNLFDAIQLMKTRFKKWTGFAGYDFFKKGEKRTRVRATEVQLTGKMDAIATGGGKYGSLSNAKIQILRTLNYGNVGTAIHRVDDLSLIGRIQNKYALPMGADISGTTSDIMGIIEILNNELFFPGLKAQFQTVPKFIQMLGPILAMVKNRHHTFLECGLVFNMLGVNNDGIVAEEGNLAGYRPCQYQALIEMIPKSVRDTGEYGYEETSNDIIELLKEYSLTPVKTKMPFELSTAYELKGTIYGGSIGSLKSNAWEEGGIFTLTKGQLTNEICNWYRVLKDESTKKFNKLIEDANPIEE